MIPDSEAFVIHDGLTSLVRLTIDWPRLITLTVIGPDDKEEGQIVLSVQADGYELNVRTARSQQCLPFLTKNSLKGSSSVRSRIGFCARLNIYKNNIILIKNCQ